MSAIPILAIATLTIYLLIGFYILFLNPRNKINVLFFIITIFLAAINIHIILLYQLTDKTAAEMNIRIGTSLTIIIFTLIVFLSVYISNIFSVYNIRKFQNVFFGILILLQTYLIYYHLSVSFFVNLMRHDDKWMIAGVPEQRHLFLLHGYYLLSILCYVLIMVLWRRKSTSKRVIKQIFILSVSFILPVLFVVFYYVFFFNFFKLTKFATIGDYSLLFVIWISGVGYCIVKYRFLSITPEYISRELISNIDESVILITPDRKIIAMNDKAKKIIRDNVISEVKDFSKIVPEYESIRGKINKLFEGKENILNCRISYPDNNQKIYMDARFSLVKDEFEDTLGILIIAKESKKLIHLKTTYNITDRQMNIVTMILDGLSNKELAGKLLISERTVENHLVNIYNKLGINNKIELYNLVQEYDFEKYA